MERPVSPRRGGLFGPLLLIAFGSVFLMNNLGILGWDVWPSIFRLWPLLLIGAGLDLLLRSRQGAGPWSAVGSLVIVVVVVGLLALGAWLMVPGVALGGREYGSSFGPWFSSQRLSVGGSLHTENINQPLENARSAEVELGFGVGSMKLSAMPESDGLIEGSIVLPQDERVAQQFQIKGDTAYFKLHNESVSVSHTNSSFPGDERRWDLKLNPEIPTMLKLNGGVGKADLDLSKLRLTGLELHGGVTETNLILPQRGRLQARVEGGIGELTVTVPRGMAVSIQLDRGLSSVDVAGNYQHLDNRYVSPEYDRAQDRIDLILRGGLGKIRVQEGEV